ncbi:hypothetical protein ACJ41O_013158 [Fusarium nematophilum]
MAHNFDIPASSTVVGVRVIDSTVLIRLPTAFFVKDQVKGHEFVECPAYAFLVEHPSGHKLLFDLALRKDLESFSPMIRSAFQRQSEVPGSSATVEKDVAGILKEEGSIELEDINAIIWRPHWGSINIPGFNVSCLILETDYQGRDLQEIDFETHPGATKLGGFRAVDYFQDGSFYLLDSPGHCVSNMAALARTTASTFILMGGDTCHHCACLRPSEHLPLPDSLSPSPFSKPPFLPGSVCPGEVLVNMHPQHARDKPFYPSLAEAPNHDVAEAENSVKKLIDFDAREDVFVVIAHDGSLLDVIDFFPKQANDWKEKGWKEEGKWRFLRDFQQGEL